MKLIVGLGNPGRKYEGTRHNVGFRGVEMMARRYGDGKAKARFQGEVMDAAIGGQKVLLLCPHTYMNLSGAAVLAARDFYKLAHEEILVVCDDVNLPLGKLRLRPKGSAGGQKGLADILRRLGDENVPRLRIGIEPLPSGWDMSDYVLSKFTKDDAEVIKQAIGSAADAAEMWVTEGADATMNRFN